MDKDELYAELSHLKRRIELKLANVADYTRYEDLLFQTGRAKKTIVDDTVRKFGFKDKTELYISTKDNTSQNRQGEAIGALLGIGLGVLLLYALSNQKK